MKLILKPAANVRNWAIVLKKSGLHLG